MKHGEIENEINGSFLLILYVIKSQFSQYTNIETGKEEKSNNRRLYFPFKDKWAHIFVLRKHNIIPFKILESKHIHISFLFLVVSFFSSIHFLIISSRINKILIVVCSLEDLHFKLKNKWIETCTYYTLSVKVKWI